MEFAQGFAAGFGVGDEAGDEGPEGGAVMFEADVGQFVDDEIVD